MEPHIAGFLSRHHIGLHYAWRLEAQTKREDALVCIPLAPTLLAVTLPSTSTTLLRWLQAEGHQRQQV